MLPLHHIRKSGGAYPLRPPAAADCPFFAKMLGIAAFLIARGRSMKTHGMGLYSEIVTGNHLVNVRLFKETPECVQAFQSHSVPVKCSQCVASFPMRFW